MTNSTPSSDELNSWKEISGHLGISIRAAQKRQKEGLPVRRMPGKKPRVWALRSELDAWKFQATTSEPHRKVEVTPDQQVLFPLPGEPATGNLRDPSLRHVRRRWVAVALAGLAVTAIAVLWIALRSNASLGPARAEVIGNTLSVTDDMGKNIWHHTFPRPLLDRGIRRADGHPGRIIQIADFYGKGSRQVLFAATFGKPDGSSETPDYEELYCFSAEGKTLWQFKPNFSVTMGGTRFNGPWNIMDLLVVPGKPTARIWLAAVNGTWRPGVLFSLSPDGVAEARFVNAGHIYAITSVATDSGHYILAGGVNNEYNAAYLAVVRENAALSCSPQTSGTRFECVDIPNVNPERYFVFPPTEVSVADGQPYNAVQRIEPVGNDELINIRESNRAGIGSSLYTLSPSLELRDVFLDNGWAAAHRQLEADGLLKHPLLECPLLKAPMRIRRWEKASGWTTVEVPFKPGVEPDSAVIRQPARHQAAVAQR